MKKVLLTGVAGFIGFHTAKTLLRKGYKIIGIDNLNDYYDIQLKQYRLSLLKDEPDFSFEKLDIENFNALDNLIASEKPDGIINLAARAGVRYSIENPFVYMNTNSNGVLNILESMKRNNIFNLVQASTSSLYAGQKMPFLEDLAVNKPISPYAASKKSAEAICYTYHYLYKFNISILRYFTVFGPIGRPDMSPFRFIKWINEGKKLQLTGDGSQSRDFTYVEDISEGTVLALEKIFGFNIINLGGGRNPVSMNQFINFIEDLLNKKADIEKSPMHPEDMISTWADIEKAKRLLGWEPQFTLEKGLKLTVNWHKEMDRFVQNISI